MSPITLDIDAAAIRLMETREGKVVKWASLSLEPTMVEDGVISDPLALGAMVKQLMTSSNINANNVIASVSGLYSVNRILTVPELAGGLSVREAALEAAEGIMPSAAERLYLSWQIIATGEGKRQVLLVGIPRDTIDAEMNALKAAGINPRILDLRAIALVRAVNKEKAIIFNIEPSSFDIVIVANGIPELMRTIAWQTGDLTVEERAEYLMANLELTVNFYNSLYPVTPLDPNTPFFITGQMSVDSALMEKLQASIEYPIEPLTPPLDCPEHLPVSQYAVNIGLALKGTAPLKNLEQEGYFPPDFNFLPETYRPWKPSAKQVYFACGLLAAIALLFPFYQIASGAMDKTADLKARYDAINAELQRRQTEIKNLEPLRKALAQYNIIVNMGSGFTEDLGVINSYAEELGIQVQSITHEGKNITVNCQTEPESYVTFEEYITKLRESGRFSTVTPPPVGFAYPTGGTIKLESKTAG